MNYYYADHANETVGPVTEDQLRELFRSGGITPKSFVIGEGETEWKAYRSCMPQPSPVSSPPPLPPTKPGETGSAWPGIGRWAMNNAEKVVVMINGLLDYGESLNLFVPCKTAPNELLDWLPLFSSIHYMMTKDYVLVITNKRFIMIRTQGIAGLSYKSHTAVPLAQVNSIRENHGLLSSRARLVVTLQNGAETTFKDVDRELARTFAALFESLRP